MKNSLIIVAILCALGIAVYLWQAGLPKSIEATENLPTGPGTSAPVAENDTVRANLIGSWRSVDDPNFEREFKSSGIAEDRYTGEERATVTGSWTIVDRNHEVPSAVRTARENDTILRIAFPEEVLFFIVVDATKDSLDLSYIGGGGQMRFTRI